MSFLQKLFKPKPDKYFESYTIGTFILKTPKKNKSIWMGRWQGVELSILGSEDEPDYRNLAFLQNYQRAIIPFDESITQKFAFLLSLNPENPTLINWRDKYEIVKIGIYSCEGKSEWQLTLKDIYPPHGKFILHIKGDEIVSFQAAL